MKKAVVMLEIDMMAAFFIVFQVKCAMIMLEICIGKEFYYA